MEKFIMATSEAVTSAAIALADAIPTVPPDATPSQMLTWVQQATPKAMDFLVYFGKKLIIAFLIFFIGKKILKWLLKLLEHSFQRSNVEDGVSHFLLSIGKGIGFICLIGIIAGYIGVGTSSIVAIVGSAGLTVGLALQGGLSNFAGGVIILLMKPFRMGDSIIALTNEGKVIGIDIFYTKLLTPDNRLIVIPNGVLANSSIVNVTNEPMRRLDIEMNIDYSQDIKKAKDILEEVVSAHEKIIKENGISIFVSDFHSSSIGMGIRVWVLTEDYWSVKCDLYEKLKEAFDKNNINIPYEKVDVSLSK